MNGPYSKQGRQGESSVKILHILPELEELWRNLRSNFVYHSQNENNSLSHIGLEPITIVFTTVKHCLTMTSNQFWIQFRRTVNAGIIMLSLNKIIYKIFITSFDFKIIKVNWYNIKNKRFNNCRYIRCHTLFPSIKKGVEAFLCPLNLSLDEFM